MNNKKSIVKLVVIIFIGVVVKLIQLPFLEDPLSKVLHLRMIKNVATTPFALVIIIMSYLLFSIIFIKFQIRINGNKIYKGFIYGVIFGFVWFYGMIEVGIIYNISLIKEIIYGLGDALPFIVMGILLGIFFGSSSKNKVNSVPLKRYVFAMFSIALIYLLGRYFSYIVIGASSAYRIRPFETFAWTLGNGLLISIIYYFMKDALHSYQLGKRAIIFSFVIFGTDWVLYNLFIPLIYNISLLQIVQSYLGRSIPDIFYACLGVFFSEKYIINSTVAPEKST